VISTVRAAGEGGDGLPPDAAARLVRDVRDPWLRDAALAEMHRDVAAAQTGLWTQLVRQAPDGWIAAPAALLGFAAWLGGHGALAWCAVERSLGDQAGYPLACRLAELLIRAVPPTRWEELGGPQGVQDPA
jgi:hypothetical protein